MCDYDCIFHAIGIILNVTFFFVYEQEHCLQISYGIIALICCKYSLAFCCYVSDIDDLDKLLGDGWYL